MQTPNPLQTFARLSSTILENAIKSIVRRYCSQAPCMRNKDRTYAKPSSALRKSWKIRNAIMLQRIVNNLLIILVLSINHSALAASGPLFHIDESGIPIKVTSTLCLNVNGQLPLSCQNYTSHHSTLNIIPTVPNHVYSYAGIKINTAGVTLVNSGLDCTPMNNGYCMFSVSNTAPKSMIVQIGRASCRERV